MCYHADANDNSREIAKIMLSQDKPLSFWVALIWLQLLVHLNNDNFIVRIFRLKLECPATAVVMIYREITLFETTIHYVFKFFVIVPWSICPDSKVHGANMRPTWVLSAPDGPHVGPMNLAIRVYMIWYVSPITLEIDVVPWVPLIPSIQRVNLHIEGILPKGPICHA